jgi:hypothetical protein
MTSSRLFAWSVLLLAVALWGVFGFLVWSLYGERVAYTDATAAAQKAELRGQSAVRLRASVQDTEVERAAMNSLLDLSILRVVEIIETTGRQAGATEVVIGEATPVPLTGNVPAGLTSVSAVVNLRGSFAAIIRAISLYETLTVPSKLDQFEIEKIDNSWRATARVRVYHAQ